MAIKKNGETIITVLKKHAQKTPNKIAYRFLVDEKKRPFELTYANLEKEVKQIAAHLLNITGTLKKQQPRALILCNPGLPYVTAFFGCLYANIIAVPLYPPSRTNDIDRLLGIIDNAQPEMILANEANISQLQNFLTQHQLTQIKLYAVDGKNQENIILPEFPNPNLSDIAFLQYTSGSTGSPKGVMVTHENLMVNSQAICHAYGHSAETVGVIWLPPYHDMGLIGGIIQSLFLGSEVVLMSPLHFLQKPIRWLKAISTYKGTTSGGNDFAYHYCVDNISIEDCLAEQINLNSWQLAFIGSETVHESTMKLFAEKFQTLGFKREAFFPCYGLAEATLMVTGGNVHELPKVRKFDTEQLQHGKVKLSKSKESGSQIVSCGSVIAQHTLSIVNPDTLQPCAQNEVGEIWFAGASVTQGYWHNESATKNTFGAQSPGSQKKYLRTGDLGFIYEEELYFVTRIKDLIIIRGKNFHADDIEFTVTHSHKALRKMGCSAFAITSANEECLVVICELIRKEIKKHNLEQVATDIRTAIGETYGIQPFAVVLTHSGALPRTSSGKIQRNASRVAYLENSLPTLYIWQKEIPVISSSPVAPPSPPEFAPKEKTDQLINWLREYAEKRINSHLFDERRCMPPYIFMDVANQGLLGMQVPKNLGGLNLSYTDCMRIMEQLGAIDISLATIVGLHNSLGVRPLLRFGTPANIEKWVPNLATGKLFCAFGMTEPSSGTQPILFQADASPQSKGWLLNGVKRWNISGWCNLMHVMVNLKSDKDTPSQLTVFTLNRDMPGVSTGPEALTMGFRGISQNAIILEDVYVDSSNLLGEIGQGIDIMSDTMAFSRLGAGVISLGALKRCAQLIHRFTSRRDIYTGILLNNPVVLEKVSILTAEITANETIIQRILHMLDQGMTLPDEIYMAAKVSATEAAWRAADLLVQLLGGRGYMENNYAPQLMRDIRVFRIGEGPTEVLIPSIGRGLMQGTQLKQFLTSAFDASDLANQLSETAKEIQEFNQKNSSPQTQAVVHTLSMLGILTIKTLLLAASEQKYHHSPTPFNRKIIDYLIKDLNEYKIACLSINSVKTARQDRGEIDQLVQNYLESIGDIEQHCPGEDIELDPILQKKQPVMSHDDYKHATPVWVESRELITKEDITTWVKKWFKTHHNIKPESIDNNVSFFAYGLDSVSAARLIADLQNFVHCPIEPAVVWEHNTLESLTNYLVDTLLTVTEKQLYFEEHIPRAPTNYNQLSIEQERLWVAEQLHKSADNNMLRTIHIKGELNIACLEKSINILLQNHEILRSSYPMRQNPERELNAYEYHFEITDLCELQPEKQQQQLTDISEKLLNKPFNVEQFPLFRIQLIQFNTEDHFLLIVLHHIIGDLISLTLIFDEIFKQYHDCLHNITTRAPENPRQYIDYVYWQRKEMETEARKELRSFWIQHLQKAPPLLELPLDNTRPQTRKNPCGFVMINLDKEKLQAIKNYAMANQTTPFIFLFSLFNILLYQFSGQRDIVLGVPTAGRYHTDLESMIGFLSYPLPFRSQITNEERFLDFLLKVNNTSIEILKHVKMTLSEIIQAVNPPRNVSYNPLFQVIFSYVVDQLTPMVVDKTEFTPLLENSRPPFGLDLFLGLYETENGVNGAISYDADIFSKDTIEYLCHNFINLITQCLTHHDLKINQLVLSERTPSKSDENFNIVIASTFVDELLHQPLNFWTKEINLPSKIHFSGYNQVFQELINPESHLLKNNKGCNTLFIRLTDWLQIEKMPSQQHILKIIQDFIESLKYAIETSNVPFIVVICPINFDVIPNHKHVLMIKNCERQLIQELQKINEVHLIAEQDILSHYPIEKSIFNPLTDKIANIPYSNEFYCAAATTLVRYIYSLNSQLRKVIVLDCDQTLWHGVCGEDSIEQIKVTFPYQVLQYFMISQQAKGKLLCLVSKNNPEDVFKIFDNHPDMLLKREHITAYKINWSSKTENILALAQELNLSTDSFIFIDDNPVECAEVKDNLPEVLTLELPPDKNVFAKFLAHVWDLDVWRVSEEDKLRTSFYQADIKRKAVFQKSPSLHDFFTSLDLKVKISPMNDNEAERISQMYLRTNQFNANPVKKLPHEIMEDQRQGFQYLAISAHDRFGDYGIIGTMAYRIEPKELYVVTFMLSCRVLGRSIERQMIKYLANLAIQENLKTVRIQLKVTEKNVPVRLYFSELIKENKEANLNDQQFSFEAEKYKNLSITPSHRKELAKKSLEKERDKSTKIKQNSSILSENIASKYNNINSILNRIFPPEKITEPKKTKSMDNTEDQIFELFKSILMLPDVDRDADFFQLGGTSFKAINIIKNIKDKFSIELSYYEFASSSSVNQLTTLIHSMQSKEITSTEKTPTPNVFDLKNDLYLHPILNDTLLLQNGFNSEPKNILLTGATGHLGIYLLNDLIQYSTAHIYCLIRAKDISSARQKIIDKFQQYNLPHEKFLSRVTIILGNLEKPYFGWQPAEYEYLANIIDVIYHSAADVNFTYHYLQLRKANVDATRDIIAFAFTQRLKTLHFISTTAIFNSPSLNATMTIKETPVSTQINDVVGGYPQSKWVAEKLVTMASKNGLPTVIYRPGKICSSLDSVEYNPKDILTQMISLSVKLGMAPNIKGAVDFSSVDYVSRAITIISQHEKAAGKVFHLTHPHPSSVQELTHEINQLGLKIECISFEYWLKKAISICEQSEDPNLKSLLPLMTDPNPDTGAPWLETIVNRPKISCLQTIKLTANQDIFCPPLEDLLMSYLAALKSET